MPQEELSFFQSPIYQEAAEVVKFTIEEASQRQAQLFAPSWYEKHFKVADAPRSESEFSAILGQIHAAPAASSLNEFSARPIRSLDGFGTAKLAMVSWGDTYKLEASDLRAILEFRRINNKPGDYDKVLNYIVDKLMNVRKMAVDTIKNRATYQAKYILSHDGKYDFTADNDPGSPFIGQQLDYGFDASHAANPKVAWTEANKATVNVLEDLMAMVEAATSEGVSFSQLLLPKKLMMYMLTTDKMKYYINGQDNASRPITENQLYGLLSQYGIPAFEFTDGLTKIEKDGGKVKRTLDAWKEGKILFVPSNDFGTIEHQYTDADLGLKSPGVDYVKTGFIELANWTTGLREGTNYTEFNSVGAKFTPVIESIQDMYSLDTTVAAS